MDIDAEREVYNFVKKNSSKYLYTILHAITDGINEENNKLREQKSSIECGFVISLDYLKNNLSDQVKSTVLKALENCTFIRVDDAIKRIK